MGESPPIFTAMCPQCLRPIRLRSAIRVMADGTVEMDHQASRWGMLIHVTRGCVRR